MNKIENLSPNERGKILYEVSQSATRMVVERTNIENLEIPLVNLPLCTEAEAEKIEEFFPKAKEGFVLSLRSERVLKKEIKNLLTETTPLTLQGINFKVNLREEQNTLPEYDHTIATLAYLLNMRRVSYFNFSNPPKGVDYELGLMETSWNFNTFSVDHIWTMMDELEKLTRESLYQEGNLELGDLLKIGHFFAASTEISKIFSF